MGWFGSDEIINSNATNTNGELIGAIALVVLAIIALLYVLVKVYQSHLKRQVQQTTRKEIRLNNINNV